MLVRLCTRWSRVLTKTVLQAVGMDAVLRGKVQQFALASEGMFPVVLKDSAAPGESRNVLMQWEHILRDDSMAAAVKWAKLKAGKRSFHTQPRTPFCQFSRARPKNDILVFSLFAELSKNCCEATRVTSRASRMFAGSA